ncbi:class I SAM-dependent methyltransferase [Actinoallomurus sp. NPDC050550]|uniref:class I SAM-dependent methyltransferase n=1 Tax=Actinoallomurus sp. NPDC050550 TaxID=3154937 RepID=UPI0034110112
MTEPDWRRLNRARWDERVPLHVAGPFYDIEGFRSGRDTIRAFEYNEVGDVTGRHLVHLQCHFGLDTLSWARRGARVTGLDFSAPAVDQARALAAELGLDARFVTADVHDAVEALGGRTYEIVYTGLGSLVWLPDVRRWAQVVTALLRPGGFLYLAEFHPFANTLDEADGRTVTADYFDAGPHVWTEPGSYADRSSPTRHNTSVQFEHGLGTVVTAIAEAGLRVEFLREHDATLFERFETLERGPDGMFRVPAGRPRIPLMYSLRARKP